MIPLQNKKTIQFTMAPNTIKIVEIICVKEKQTLEDIDLDLIYVLTSP